MLTFSQVREKPSFLTASKLGHFAFSGFVILKEMSFLPGLKPTGN
jgi:hypothetical protein